MRRLSLLLFILMGRGPTLAAAQDPVLFPDEQKIEEVARSPEWLKLLHYRKPFLRTPVSDVDAAAFFLSRNGKTDALAELRATLAAFLNVESASRRVGPIAQSAFCAFPARRAFLESAFGAEFTARVSRLAADKNFSCEEFETWRAGISARGVSLVYSSAYPNNPASMFGHTFLRLDRSEISNRGTSRSSDLMSYGVNFSATTGVDENPVKFALWGLFGGYDGRYDLAPYFRKVNEYAYSESRDLWEYRLSLTANEVAQLVRHIWELYGAATFDYYFLDENCSFQILTALEAARPDWDLSSGFWLSVIPIQTVKHLLRIPEAVVDVDYRPSLRNEMVRGLARLSPQERSAVDALFAGKILPDSSISIRQLDALLSALAYEKERGISEGKKSERAGLLRNTLLERSRRGNTTSVLDTPEDPLRPDQSHGSSRFSVSASRRDRSNRIGLSLYAFRHDLLDRTPSFNAFSEVRLFGFRAEKREGESPKLREADLIGMSSLAPSSRFDPQKSWKVGLRWEDYWQAAGGYGVGAHLFGERNLAYALAAGEVGYSSKFSDSIRVSPGADFGIVLNPLAERYFIHLRAQALWDLIRTAPGSRWRPVFEVSQAFSVSRDFDLRFSGRWNRTTGLLIADGSEWTNEVEIQAGFRF